MNSVGAEVMISTHALTWSATYHRQTCSTIKKFQLTHSRGVRLACAMCAKRDAKFQLTHSRGVRPRLILNVNHVAKISTHALTWSATESDTA